MVAGVAQRRGIDQVDVPLYKRGKRLLGMTRRVFPQQFHVARDSHLPINVRPNRMATAFLNGVAAALIRPSQSLLLLVLFDEELKPAVHPLPRFSGDFKDPGLGRHAAEIGH